MKIEIRLNSKEARHLQSPHTFYDECEPACDVLRKVQKEIDKNFRIKKYSSLIKNKLNNSS